MEMEEKKPRGNTVILMVIGIATLVASLTAATMAYFTATITPSNQTSSVTIQTATIGISYDNGNSVTITGLQPDGVIPSKTVTIANGTNYDAVYSLRWSTVTNTFVDQTDLKYAIDCETTVGTGTPDDLVATQAPSSGVEHTALSTVTLDANSTHVCVISFTFADDLTVQDDNQGVSFTGNFEVVADPI